VQRIDVLSGLDHLVLAAGAGQGVSGEPAVPHRAGTGGTGRGAVSRGRGTVEGRLQVRSCWQLLALLIVWSGHLRVCLSMCFVKQ